MGNKSTAAWEGWSIVGAVTIALILGVTMEAMAAPEPADAIRGIIRLTARSSFVLFALAFTAAAAWRFWPNPWTRWQQRNRRYLGVAFAVAQTFYLFALLALGRIAPGDLAATASPATWMVGALAYLFIALMTLTSFDSTARQVSPRAWSILHTTGSYYLWLVFASNYLSRAAIIPGYVPFAVLVVFILVLRVAARISKLRARHSAVQRGGI